MVYQDNRIITLNSQDGEKQNGTYLSNINFNFSGLLSDDKNIIRTYITVLNAQFPVSFYIIEDDNNVLSYTENSVPKTITITIGNYNGNQMVTALNTGFTANGSNVTVTLNSQNGILYFFITGGASFTFLSTSTIKSILGFSSDITSTTAIIMPYQLNLLGKKKIFINSNNLRNSAFSSKSLSCVQTIASVPVDQPPYAMINYTSVSDLEKNIIFNRSLDMLDIQIVDEENKYVNFRNINWSITLCLTIEKDDKVKIEYGLLNLPQESLNQNLENSIENPKKISRDEKDLKLLES
jgi:hypothetical protein